MRKILIGMAALLVAACNPVANMNRADEMIVEFHALYNDADIDGMWDYVGPEFRAVTTRQDFENFYQVIDQRLGAVESSTRQNFHVNSGTGGTTTTVVMTTEFSDGPGSETFTFLGKDEQMALIGWTVNADRLMFTAEDLASEENVAE